MNIKHSSNRSHLIHCHTQIMEGFTSFEKVRIGFFIGAQGTQYPEMGKKLYESFPEFAEEFDKCDAMYEKLTGKLLKDSIWQIKDTTAKYIDDRVASCAGIFAIEMGFIRLFASLGIFPSAILGYSFGEIGAAVVAGILELENALTYVIRRAELTCRKAPQGLLVRLDGFKREEILIEFKSIHPNVEVELAFILAPTTIVVGGFKEAVQSFTAFCQERSIPYAIQSPERLSHAFHTPNIEAILPELEILSQSLVHSHPTLPFISGYLEREVKLEDFSPAYWTQMTRKCLNLPPTLKTFQEYCDIIVEVSPIPKLKAIAALNYPDGTGVPVLPVMQARQDDCEVFLKCLKDLGQAGVSIDSSHCQVSNNELKDQLEKLFI